MHPIRQTFSIIAVDREADQPELFSARDQPRLEISLTIDGRFNRGLGNAAFHSLLFQDTFDVIA